MIMRHSPERENHIKRSGSYLFRLKTILLIYLPIILIVAGLLAPSIISSQRLSEIISKYLQNQTKSKVRIRNAKFSWLNGLKLAGVKIEDISKQNIIKAKTVRIPVNLFDFIMSGSIGYIRIEGLNVNISPENGRVPLIINQQHGGQRIALPVKRIQIAGCNVSVDFKDKSKTTFSFPWLEIVNNISKQNIQWYGHCRVQFTSATKSKLISGFAGSIALAGNLKVAESEGQKIFAGTIKINWRKLALDALRIHRIKQLNLNDLHGISNGSLTFTIFPDFNVEWNLKTDFDKLDVVRKDGTATDLRNFSLVSIGKYDPLAGNIDMSKFNITSPSMKVNSKFNLKFENAILAESNLQISGKFDTRLANLIFPDTNNATKFSGYCGFDVNCKIKGHAYKLQASLNADNAEFVRAGIITKRQGQPANMIIAIQADTSNWPWMDVNKFKLKFGEVTVNGLARLPRIYTDDDFDSWADRTRKLGQIEFDINSKHIGRLTKQVTSAKRLFDKLNLSGPVKINVGYTGQNNIASCDLKIALQKTSTLRIENFYVKPKQNDFVMRVKTYWPWKSDYGKLTFLLDADCGKLNINTYNRPARLVWSVWRKEKLQSTFIDTISDISLQINNSENIIKCSPWLEAKGLANKFAGTIVLDFANIYQFIINEHRWDINRGRTFAKIDASNAAIALPNQFRKQPQQPLRVTLDYKYNRIHHRHRLATFIDSSGLKSNIEITRWQDKGTHYNGKFALDVSDIVRAISPLTIVKRWLGDTVKLAGGFACNFNWSKSPELSTLHWNINASGTNISVNDKIIKASSIPAIVKGGLSVQLDKRSDKQTYKFAPMEIQLAGNSIHLIRGNLRLSNVSEGKWLKLVGVEPWTAFRKSPIKFFNAALTGSIEANDQIRIIAPQLADLFKKCNTSGLFNFDLNISLEHNLLQAHIRSDLNKLSIAYGSYFVKPIDTPGKLDIDISIWPDSESSKPWFCTIDNMSCTIKPIKIKSTGYCKIDWTSDNRLTLTEADLHSMLSPVNLKQLRKLSPLLKRLSTTGKLSSIIHLKNRNRQNTFGLSLIDFDNITGKTGNYPFAIDGRIEFSDNYLSCDELALLLGNSSLKSSWQSFSNAKGGITGYGDFASQHIDFDEIRRIIKVSANIPTETAKSANKATIKSHTHKPKTQDQLIAKLQPIFEWANKSDILLNFDSTIFRYTNYAQHVTHKIKNLLCKAKITDNHHAKINFWGRLSDGMIKGNISADLSERNPTVILTSQLYNLKMNPSLQPLVENFFPGLKVTGRISIKERYHFKMFTTARNAPNNPVGKGEMVFVDGYMQGKAAPDWVTRIFPQLNFAKYEFSRMHNWFVKMPDGTVHNNMIYRGKPWNIYIEGDSFPDGRIKYEVGVDLLARFESKYWSSVGQGRVPIFTTEGTIRDGKFVGQKIRYVPPYKVVYQVFIKNNLLTAAYRILKRQISKSQ